MFLMDKGLQQFTWPHSHFGILKMYFIFPLKVPGGEWEFSFSPHPSPLCNYELMKIIKMLSQSFMVPWNDEIHDIA